MGNYSMNEYYAYELEFVEKVIQYIQAREPGDIIEHYEAENESEHKVDGLLDRLLSEHRVIKARDRYDRRKEEEAGRLSQKLFEKLDKIVPQGESHANVLNVLATPAYNKKEIPGSNSYYIRYVSIKEIKQRNSRAIRTLEKMRAEIRKRSGNVPSKNDTLLKIFQDVSLKKY